MPVADLSPIEKAFCSRLENIQFRFLGTIKIVVIPMAEGAVAKEMIVVGFLSSVHVE